MQIQCSNCGRLVPAENLNLDNLVGKCAECDSVFRLALDDLGEVQVARRPENLAQPAGYEVNDFGNETVVSKKWFQPLAFVFLVIFTLVWNGMVWGVYLFLLGDDHLFRWFLLPFQLAGLLIAYLTLAVLLNTTAITLTRDRLSVRAGPLKVPGKVDLDVRQIEQLFVEQRIHHSNRHNGMGNTSVGYALVARLTDGAKKTVMRGFRDYDEAIWLEQFSSRNSASPIVPCAARSERLARPTRGTARG